MDQYRELSANSSPALQDSISLHQDWNSDGWMPAAGTEPNYPPRKDSQQRPPPTRPPDAISRVVVRDRDARARKKLRGQLLPSADCQLDVTVIEKIASDEPTDATRGPTAGLLIPRVPRMTELDLHIRWALRESPPPTTIVIPMDAHIQWRGECARHARRVPEDVHPSSLRSPPRRISLLATPETDRHHDIPPSPLDHARSSLTLHSRVSAFPPSSPPLPSAHGNPGPRWRDFERLRRGAAPVPRRPMGVADAPSTARSPSEMGLFLGQGRGHRAEPRPHAPPPLPPRPPQPGPQLAALPSPASPSPTLGRPRSSVWTCAEAAGEFSTCGWTGRSSTGTRWSGDRRELDYFATSGMMSVFEDDDEGEKAGLVGYFSGRRRVEGGDRGRRCDQWFGWVWGCWFSGGRRG